MLTDADQDALRRAQKPDEVSKEDAIAAVTAAAWPEMGEACGHTGCEDHREVKRRLIHSRAGMFGADSTLEGAIAEIQSAQQCLWVADVMGHDLLVVTAEGRRHFYEVRRPES